MDLHERAAQLAQALQDSGRVEVHDIAARFGVSEMTVRRDLERLEEQGLCRRVHGGAVKVFSRSYEPPFALRQGHAPDAKRRIGDAVANLLKGGETVMLDTGTTTLAVARALRGRDELTVVTASLPIATTLADEAGIRVILLGGLLRLGERSMVGATTVRAMEQFHVDVGVLGAGGVDARAGLTEFHLEDAAVKRAVVERSCQVVVAADASKLGVVAFASVCAGDDINVLVTDADVPTPEAAEFSGLGVELVHV